VAPLLEQFGIVRRIKNPATAISACIQFFGEKNLMHYSRRIYLTERLPLKSKKIEPSYFREAVDYRSTFRDEISTLGWDMREDLNDILELLPLYLGKMQEERQLEALGLPTDLGDSEFPTNVDGMFFVMKSLGTF
jgi:hypothetical protein